MKKWTAFFLALLICLLPVSAVAASPCDNGHTAGSTLHDPTYADCTGGFKSAWYECTVCGQPCDAAGNNAQSFPPVAAHTLGGENAPTYFDCSGGFKTAWYECSVCGRSVDANGNEAVLYPAVTAHTPGNENTPDYTDCTGGFKSTWYECTVCGQPCDTAGNDAAWYPAVTAHTLGSENAPNYVDCSGGFKSTWYECTVCGQPCDADGNDVAWCPAVTAHALGSKNDPDYLDCSGGFKTAWYECSVCGCAVDANGNNVPWYPAASQHDLVKIPYTPPTYTSDGYQTYWQCSICDQCFFDEDGTHLIADERDMASLIVPRLTDPGNSSLQTSISTGLTSVPETVAQQYPTVDAIYQALVQAAQGSNASLKQNDGSVLLDVTLQVRGDDGTLTTVAPENFPAEGVEVLLPYPQGTDRSCTFVITHMITSGEHAGQIETLKGIKTKDGILVRFTSMSPVCITYQTHTSTGADRTAADTAVGVSSPKTADSSRVALWSAACVCSAALLLSMTVKKKKHA